MNVLQCCLQLSLMCVGDVGVYTIDWGRFGGRLGDYENLMRQPAQTMTVAYEGRLHVYNIIRNNF